jgi:hypothetical protein
MSEAKKRKEKQDDPIAKKLLNSEQLSWTEAIELVSLKLREEVSRTTTVFTDDPRKKGLKRRAASVLLRQLLMTKDIQDNTIEALLATQMTAFHNAGMQFTRMAMAPDISREGAALNINSAAKCISMFIRQLETFNKNRGKGQQKITVQHQHVNVQSVGNGAIANIVSAEHPKGEQHKPAIAKSVEQPFTVDAEYRDVQPLPIEQGDEDDA